MRLLDRINRECLDVLEPEFVVLNINTFAQLLDELSEEEGRSVQDTDVIKVLGIRPLLDEGQKQDFVLARKCD